MSSNVVAFLNRYDIFGKSIPGAVSISGAYFLLPNRMEFALGLPESPLEVIGLVFSVLIFGLLIGEAIHTFSRLIEGVFIIIGLRLVPRLRRVKIALDGIGAKIRIISYYQFRKRNGEDDQDGNGEDDQDGNGEDDQDGNGEDDQNNWKVKSKILTILIILFETIARLVELPGRIGEIAFGFLYPAFQRHRILFRSWLRSNYTADPDHWNPGNQGVLSEEFREVCESKYNINLRKDSPTDSFYTLITARVGQSGAVLSQRFQDLYSFSRSMWVVILLLLIWYAVIFTFQIYLPWWHLSVSVFQIILIGIMLLVLFSLFLIAAGRYKQAYIEYLISDFVSIHYEE